MRSASHAKRAGLRRRSSWRRSRRSHDSRGRGSKLSTSFARRCLRETWSWRVPDWCFLRPRILRDPLSGMGASATPRRARRVSGYASGRLSGAARRWRPARSRRRFPSMRGSCVWWRKTYPPSLRRRVKPSSAPPARSHGTASAQTTPSGPNGSGQRRLSPAATR